MSIKNVSMRFIVKGRVNGSHGDGLTFPSGILIDGRKWMDEAEAFVKPQRILVHYDTFSTGLR